MTFQVHSRRFFQPAIAILLLSAATVMAVGQPAFMRKTGQAARPAMAAPRPPQGQKQNAPKQNGPKQNQEHLPQWMARHSNLSPTDQQKALENEPGFRELSNSRRSSGMRNRLTQLNNDDARSSASMDPGAQRNRSSTSHRRSGSRLVGRCSNTRDFLKTAAAWSRALSGACARCRSRSAKPL